MNSCSKRSQKLCNLLGICRKAGKLILGFDPVKEAYLNGTAKLILTAQDASPRTVKETAFLCQDSGLNRPTDIPMDALEQLFHRRVAVMAVCDEGFAKRFSELLDTAEPESE